MPVTLGQLMLQEGRLVAEVEHEIELFPPSLDFPGKVDGADVTGTTGRMGYMLQKDLLLPWRTVLENVLLGRRLQHRTTAADRAEALDLLERYGLGGFTDHYPHALSGGMRQRAALIRTIVFSRELLLLDEPFGALDSQTRLLMQEWLLRVCAEIDSTILFITHDIDEALFLADRVIVMYAGRESEVGTTHEVFYDTRHPYTLGLLASMPRLDDTGVERLP